MSSFIPVACHAVGHFKQMALQPKAHGIVELADTEPMKASKNYQMKLISLSDIRISNLPTAINSRLVGSELSHDSKEAVGFSMTSNSSRIVRDVALRLLAIMLVTLYVKPQAFCDLFSPFCLNMWISMPLLEPLGDARPQKNIPTK